MDHFTSLPWFGALMKQPGFVTFTPTCRLQEDATGYSPTQDQLFRKTLNNQDAIPHCIGFYDEDAFADLRTETPQESSVLATQLGQRLLIPSCSLVFDLRPGVNGFNGTTHGGLIASLIDEAMGSLILINHEAQKKFEAERTLPAKVLNLNNIRVFTASMNVRFQKPLETPQGVVVTASLGKVEGRKIHINVVVKNEKGDECAKCDGMWMSLPKEKI